MTQPDIVFHAASTELRIGHHPSRRVLISVLNGDDYGKDTLGLAVDPDTARLIADAINRVADTVEGMDRA